MAKSTTTTEAPKRTETTSGLKGLLIAGYGWTPDLPDHRDHQWRPPYGAQKATPASADLTATKGYPATYDQGDLGSCTFNAIPGAMQISSLISGAMIPMPSRLAGYYDERVIEGTVKSDSGAQIRDGIKVAAAGVPLEADWPYDPAKFATKPPKSAYKDGLDVAVEYSRLTRDKNLAMFRAALGVTGRPFVFGFTVYESFESQQVASDGIVPMPESGEKVLGGHAVCAVGYDDSKQFVKCRNSWGDGWGAKGHFFLPYAYFTTASLSSDFWVINTDTQKAATS